MNPDLVICLGNFCPLVDNGCFMSDFESSVCSVNKCVESA